ncbi:SDR family NAD(P)-dependent oxidoreductase [Boudabousia marimammalium]|uniref:Short-chain dehydrogenase n=1 Tax=Boudabousia marimammalium TaxID=156892 RepID=A0A1Q5PKJ2_9ACTO|nr:SDR family NAD(P)-dependent oxidoreductase [Boudabousia marimammalium]OKL46733.1 short-chain dehydrogenase [Boudabousia marimammalium]
MGTALITGATSGIGEEFAWQLAAAGHNLVLVARRKELLEQLAERLSQGAGVHTEVIVADLTETEGLEKVAERIQTDGPRPIGLLVNNAGMALGQTFSDGTLEREIQALDLMVKSVLVLSWTAVKAMRRRNHGAILNVSSMASRSAYGTYAAHKAWVRSFTEGLSAELSDTRVTATAVMPGWVRTEFLKSAGLDESIWPDYVWIPVDKVVSSALRAVRRGRVEDVPTLPYRMFDHVLHFAPRPLVRWVTGKVRHSGQVIV